jgi:hypothetical protein
MFNATLQRDPWLKAIQRMCYENSLCVPSFPVDDMNLLEPEYAALAPRRWEILANSRKDSPLGDMLPVVKTQVVTTQNFFFYRLHLTPGGRFLVITSNDDSSVSITTIASIPNYYSYFAAHPIADQLGIRIFTNNHQIIGGDSRAQ